MDSIADIDGHDILEALRFATADRLKSAQRKFTTARNTLNNDALSHPYNAFFSNEEKDALSKAAAILGNFKRKVEHAKEIKAREEKTRERRLKALKAKRLAILVKYLPEPTDAEGQREEIILHLALQEHCGEIRRGAFFSHGIFFLESDLKRGIDDHFSHSRVSSVAVYCRRKTIEWLEENLWPYDEDPEVSGIEKVLHLYQDEWRAEIVAQYADFLNRYDQGMVSEAARDERARREREVASRRSSIKAVK